jgi:hypothetical protein
MALDSKEPGIGAGAARDDVAVVLPDEELLQTLKDDGVIIDENDLDPRAAKSVRHRGSAAATVPPYNRRDR